MTIEAIKLIIENPIVITFIALACLATILGNLEKIKSFFSKGLRQEKDCFICSQKFKNEIVEAVEKSIKEKYRSKLRCEELRGACYKEREKDRLLLVETNTLVKAIASAQKIDYKKENL